VKELKELDIKATCKESLQVQIEGNRTVLEIPNARLRKAICKICTLQKKDQVVALVTQMLK
jgi:hypothetical protein